jgi:hypothetical protein
MGDRLRPAPVLTGAEGLTAPGEDGYGPTAVDVDLSRFLRTVWSGSVVLEATVASLTGVAGSSIDEVARHDLATLYEVAAARWRGFAERHPGSARLWLDLGARAERTAAVVSP